MQIAIIGVIGVLIVGVIHFITRKRPIVLAAEQTKPTFADVDGFVNMLRGACDDKEMHQTLEKILTQPDDKRKQLLHVLIDDLRAKNAPRDLIDAFICLLDNEAAEKAYTVIYQCEQRGQTRAG